MSLPRAQLLRRAASGVATGIVLLLAAGSARAAERRQLAPIDRDFGFYAPYAQMHAYHVAVRDALLGAKTRRSCEAIVIPSFQKEWSIHLQPAASGSGQEVVHTVMKRQLWGETQMAAGRDRSIRPRDESAALARIPKPTLRFSAPLSATSATALDRLWEAMLARVEEPAEPVRCIDGTSYSVFQWHEKTGSRGGWGQCPGSGSPPAALLELLEELRKAARSSGTALMQEDMHIAVTATQLLREVR